MMCIIFSYHLNAFPFELSLPFVCRTQANLTEIKLSLVGRQSFYTLVDSNFSERTNVEMTSRNFEIDATEDSLQPFSLQQ